MEHDFDKKKKCKNYERCKGIGSADREKVIEKKKLPFERKSVHFATD
jgi:hypothetical protein